MPFFAQVNCPSNEKSTGSSTDKTAQVRYSQQSFTHVPGDLGPSLHRPTFGIQQVDPEDYIMIFWHKGILG